MMSMLSGVECLQLVVGFPHARPTEWSPHGTWTRADCLDPDLRMDYFLAVGGRSGNAEGSREVIKMG